MSKRFRKKSNEKAEQFFERISKKYVVESNFQGVSLSQVESVLSLIGKYTEDVRDVVSCLLNDDLPSLFPNAKKHKICDGASVAHIASYVGVLIRGNGKLDREGRDYWIKPLREIGAIDALTFDAERGFLPGHIKPKSPNSCYRLNSSFVALLKSSGTEEFEKTFKEWISADNVRKRLNIQREAEEAALKLLNGNPHETLIQYSIDLYAKHFLPGYIVIYKDDSDGERISHQERELMKRHGVLLELEDAFPDIILYNPDTNTIWFIEAVTSDGEVDAHKLNGLKHICEKSNKEFGGSTTTYLKWKTLALRQQTHKNLANRSKIWIVEDPQKQFEVQFEP